MIGNIEFKDAYFIQLGRNGEWEQSSIDESKMRIGWGLQQVADLKADRLDALRKSLSGSHRTKGAVTRDLNSLRTVCNSTPHDIWITFFSSRLWWCRVEAPDIQQDAVSRYRKVDRWSDVDIQDNVLLTNRIPGDLSKVQRFQGTVCKVRRRATLKRLLNNEPSPAYELIQESRDTLIDSVRQGIKNLHWKDFELFVDLLFRASGWRRLSMLGETMKFVDLELEDPLTNDKYQVQIESAASMKDFETYANQFGGAGYRKLYFVVHSPDAELANNQERSPDIELILPDRLAEMAVSLGLVDWLMQHIK